MARRRVSVMLSEGEASRIVRFLSWAKKKLEIPRLRSE